MLYLMPHVFLADAYQAWLASLRDQAALQMIAGEQLQHQVSCAIEKALESSVDLVQDPMETVFGDCSVLH